jgi:pimeloyl-ACP methyl ester carboxylesterase
MQYESFTANDGTAIAYQTSIPVKSTKLHGKVDTTSSPTRAQLSETCILLLHGFSGSSEYFIRNTRELSKDRWVITPDFRGHGRSQRTRYGYHVARLAKDLHELITTVVRSKNQTARIYAVGCSIGAAVLWTYIELFTDVDFSGLILVDQAPLQDRSMFDGWGLGLAHYGCYDEATTLEAQRSWASEDPKVKEATYSGLVASCLGYRYAPNPGENISEQQKKADELFFTAISRACHGPWLARLLADHTRYDHREAIELITKPVLVMAGRRSGCFSIEGMTEIVRRVQNHGTQKSIAEIKVFDSGHWLFWEESERFNQVLLEFVAISEQLKTSS